MVAVFQRLILIDFALSGLVQICTSIFHWAAPNAFDVSLSGFFKFKAF